MATVTLNGSARSSLPLTLLWTRQSGPSSAVINSPAAASTTVTITDAGTYVFRLTATDSVGEDTFDEVTVTAAANATPVVDAGDDVTVTEGVAFQLQGSASDADASQTLTVTWTKQSGPGTATFVDDNDADTQCTLSAEGTVVLRLTAADGVTTAFDEVTVTVEALDAPGTIYNSNTPIAAGSTLTDCEYKVDLSTMSANWWAAVNADGSDIRVTLSDGTLLPFDLINFNATADTGLLVFKHGASASPVEYRIWAGHPTFAALPATDPNGKNNAYRSDCLAFWPNGSGTDRTVNALTLTHNTAPSTGAGPIGALSSDYATGKYGRATLATPRSAPVTVLGVTNKDPDANTCTLVGIVNTALGTVNSINNSVAAAAVEVATVRNCRAFCASATGNWLTADAATTSATWRQYAASLRFATAEKYGLVSANTNAQTEVQNSGTAAAFGWFYNADRIVLGAFPALTPSLHFLNGSLSLVAVYSSRLANDLIQYYEDMLDQSTFWDTWTEGTP